MTATGSGLLTGSSLFLPAVERGAVVVLVRAVALAHTAIDPHLELAPHELDEVAHVLVLHQPVGLDLLQRGAGAERGMFATAGVEQPGGGASGRDL